MPLLGGGRLRISIMAYCPSETQEIIQILINKIDRGGGSIYRVPKYNFYFFERAFLKALRSQFIVNRGQLRVNILFKITKSG